MIILSDLTKFSRPRPFRSAVSQNKKKEVGQFQNRLSRAMHECEDKARDAMKPGWENDAKQMANVESVLLQCISKTVDEYIGKLQPMKDRVAAQLKKVK